MYGRDWPDWEKCGGYSKGGETEGKREEEVKVQGFE